MKLTDDQITVAATKYAVPFQILKAITLAESSGNPWATRYEPDYKYLFGSNLTATEKAMQMTSYGVCQVMGAVAREYGFKGAYLTQLCDPEVGLEYGARHLAQYFKRYGTWERAVASYNAGSPIITPGGYVNQVYVDRVRSLVISLGGTL